MADKPKIDLNLDALENEERPEPFTFILKGKRYKARDPQEMEWRENMELGHALSNGDGARGLRILLGTTQYGEFEKTKVPAWKIQKLLNAASEHYEGTIGDEGEEDASDG